MICHLVEARGAAPPFLIAAPASVLPNWAAELARWAPRLRVVQYRGSAAERECIYDSQVRAAPGGTRGPAGAGGRARADANAAAPRRRRAPPRHLSPLPSATAAARAAQVARGPPFHVLLTSYDFLMAKNDRPRLARAREWWAGGPPQRAAAPARCVRTRRPLAVRPRCRARRAADAALPPLPCCSRRRRCIVVDEGHRLKNADCKLSRELRAYRSRARLLLTGAFLCPAPPAAPI
jgi:SNF2 family DNA or RNA helicase